MPAFERNSQTTSSSRVFSDVKVMPDSFLVQAKDKSGNPVTMFITPNSFAEISAMEADNTGAEEGGLNSGTSSGAPFVSVPSNEELSSKVLGADVYNKANQDIGTIKDIAFNANGVKAYVVGVGGVLGIGDHGVAVRPSALKLSWDANNKKWRAAIDATIDEIKAAPEFKYPSPS